MKRVLLLVAALFTLVNIAFPQERPKRHATVITTDDKRYEGAFVKADEITVTIEADNIQTTIKLDTVKLIMFGGAASDVERKASSGADTTAQKEAESREAIGRAVTALRKLNSATTVGVNFLEYSRLLIEAKAVVDAELPKINPYSSEKVQINSAMYEYAYASRVWNYFNQNSKGYIPTKTDLARTLIREYEIPLKIGVFSSLARETALGHIWRKANKHFEAATSPPPK